MTQRTSIHIHMSCTHSEGFAIVRKGNRTPKLIADCFPNDVLAYPNPTDGALQGKTLTYPGRSSSSQSPLEPISRVLPSGKRLTNLLDISPALSPWMVLWTNRSQLDPSLTIDLIDHHLTQCITIIIIIWCPIAMVDPSAHSDTAKPKLYAAALLSISSPIYFQLVPLSSRL